MKKDTTKSTVLVISMGFLLIYLIYGFQPFLYLSLAIGVLGLADSMSRWIERAWMGLAKLLSYIVPNILLTLVFYIILYPLALIYRFTQKDPLLLSPDHKTYWIEEEKKFDKESLKKTW